MSGIRYPFVMFWDTVEGDFQYEQKLGSRPNERPFLAPKQEKAYEDYLNEELQYHNPNRRKPMSFGTSRGVSFEEL